jgi:hypothetical protein
MDEILCELDKKPCDQDYLKALVKLHNGEIQSVSTLTNVIDSIYERELSLLTQREECNKMTAGDKFILADEFGKLSSLVNRMNANLSNDVFTNLKLNFERDFRFLTDNAHSLSNKRCI